MSVGKFGPPYKPQFASAGGHTGDLLPWKLGLRSKHFWKREISSLSLFVDMTLTLHKD